MKKIKRIRYIIATLSLVLIISILLPLTSQAKVDPNDPSNGYQSQGYNDRYRIHKIPLEDNTIYMSLDPHYRMGVHPDERARGTVAASHPNLFIHPNTNPIGSVRDVNFFTSRKYGGYQSGSIFGTNFLIAEKKEGRSNHQVWSHPLFINSGDYYIDDEIKGLYSETYLYTDGKTSDSNGQSIPPRMKIGVEVKPVSNSLIRFTYTVENISDTPLEFIPLQNIPVEISHVQNGIDPPVRPVIDLKMLGENEGVSAEDNGYRLNYLFKNTPNGPDNFASYGIPNRDFLFIMPDATFGNKGIDYDFYKNANWIYDPYENNSIYGHGVEAEGYKPNEILKSKSVGNSNPYSNSNSNGIAIKWNETVLLPNESQDFSYDVQMFADFGINYLFHKKDEPKAKEYKVGDTIVFQPSGNWNTKDYQLSEGSITTTIAPEVLLKDNDIVKVRALETSGSGLESDVIKEVKVKDVYDKDSRLLSVPITKEEVVKIDSGTDAIGLEFNGLLTKQPENQDSFVTQTATVKFKDDNRGKEYTRIQPISFKISEGELPDNYDISVDKAVKESGYYIGDTASYTITATNSESSTNSLLNAELKDTLPYGLGKPTNIKIDGSLISDSQVNWNENNRELIIDLGDISVGNKTEMTYQSLLESGQASEEKVNHVILSGDKVEDVEAEASFVVKESIKHVVTFDTRGGSQIDSVEVIDGEQINKPNDPTYTNRLFMDWYTDKELTKIYQFDTPVKQSMTLYAKWQSRTLDPTDPNNPVDPTKPVDKDLADLRIAYVSNFDFGRQENSKEAFKKQSKKDVIQVEKETIKNVPSFVSIIDDRPIREPWQLTAKSTVFQTDSRKVLTGASLVLSDLNYKGQQKNPIPTKGEVNISSESGQKIANSEIDTEGTSWSLAMGNLNGDDVSGVTLDVPYGSYKDPSSYKATIEWNLSPRVRD